MGLAGGAWRSAAARRWLLITAVALVAVLALWAMPRAREHLLTVGVAGLLVGAAGLTVPFLLRRLERRDAVDERRRARDRAVMLKRVRNRWITGVLDQSLTEEARIRLGLTRRPEVIAPPGMLIRRPGHAAEPLQAGTPIHEVFAALGGGLLILGAPGSGKTTALLELARDLLEDAEADQNQPIPVVFNLSSWAARRLPIAEWLIEQLRTRYDVAQSIARQWVAAGAILPLLDGLDEVANAQRAGCVEAINAFCQDHGPLQIAVCSRTEEYTTLATQLRVEEALELQPPTREQVSGYLETAGAALTDVQAALEADETLWDFLQSPLVLNIVALTYQDREADALRATGTPEQRLALLFAAYTERMLEHRPGRYTPARMLPWLAWLACSMRERNQTEFHLDRLQPDWLPTKTQRRLVALIPVLSAGLAIGLAGGLVDGLVHGLVYGLGVGLPVGLFFALFFGLRRTEPVEEIRWSWLTWSRVRAGLCGGLVVGLVDWLADVPIYGLVRALTNGLTFALIFMLVFMLFAGLRKTEPVEEVRWSWPEVRTGLFAGLVLGLGGGLVYGLSNWLGYGLVYGLANGLLFALFIAPVGGLVHGLVPALVDERSTPNEGIHRSARHALGIGLFIGVFVGLGGGLAFELVFGLANGLGDGLRDGLVLGPAVGLLFGGLACLQHLVLRSLLAYHGLAPLCYVRFLDEATERLFLRRTGSGYIFVHRLLLNYLASIQPAREAERPAPLSS